MSVVAWDGKAVAADKQATCSSMRFTVTKLRRLGTGEVLAWTGDLDSGVLLAQWFEDGADPAKWPKCQEDKDQWVRLLVFSSAGARFYERQPVAVAIEDRFMAWGSGRDYAVGALACGKTAREAVEIAARFSTECGMGVDEEVV